MTKTVMLIDKWLSACVTRWKQRLDNWVPFPFVAFGIVSLVGLSVITFALTKVISGENGTILMLGLAAIVTGWYALETFLLRHQADNQARLAELSLQEVRAQTEQQVRPIIKFGLVMPSDIREIHAFAKNIGSGPALQFYGWVDSIESSTGKSEPYMDSTIVHTSFTMGALTPNEEFMSVLHRFPSTKGDKFVVKAVYRDIYQNFLYSEQTYRITRDMRTMKPILITGDLLYRKLTSKSLLASHRETDSPYVVDKGSEFIVVSPENLV